MKNIKFILLMLWGFFNYANAQSNCQISNVIATPVVGNMLEYEISFSLTLAQPLNNSMSIIGSNPNGGTISNLPANLLSINLPAGTHTVQTKLTATSAIPVGTPINFTFSVGRVCNATAPITFPAPYAECFFLRGIQISCQPNSGLKLSYELSNLGQAVNGTLIVKASDGTLSNPGAGGSLSGTSQITFNVGNPISGKFEFDFGLTPASATVTPSLTFELKSPTGATVCASKISLRPYPSLCGDTNRCNNFTVTTEPSQIVQNSSVLYGNFKIAPAQEAKVTSAIISIVNIERRSECQGTNPSPWESIFANGVPMLLTSGSGLGITNIAPATYTSSPAPNSLVFTSTGVSDASNGGDHILNFRGLPEKKNAACPERLRFTLRYLVRNSNGCSAEFHRIAEIVR
ncbi:hypothetical protein [Rhodoflexus sp.]